MIYRFIAEFLLIAHLCYILFVVFGGLLILRWSNIWKLHLPAVIWGFLVQYFVWECPLTSWENYFRDLSGEAGYSDGFVNYFLTAILYPDIGENFHIFLAVSLVFINASLYFYIFHKKTN